MSWAKLQIPSVVPPGVSQVASAVTSAADTLNSALTTVEDALSVVASLEASATDPTAAAIQQLIKGIQNTLTGLLKANAGLHFLAVPIGKVNGIPQVPIIPGDIGFPTSLTASGYTGSGGNLGFYNTVNSACYDRGDISRPVYGVNDAITAAVVLFGSDDLGAVLDTCKAMAGLLGPLSTPLDAGQLPVPRNLKIRAIPVTPTITDPLIASTAAGTNSTVAFSINWDPAPVVSSMAAYGGSVAAITKLIVYRDTKSFSSSTPQSQLVEYFTMPYNGLVTTFIDQNTDPTEVYNYAVGYQVSVDSVSGSSRLLSTVGISNVIIGDATLGLPGGVVFSHGIPPDWKGVSNSLDLLLPVKEIVNLVNTYIGSLAGSIGSTTSSLDNIVTSMKSFIATNQAIIDKMSALTSTLTAALSTPALDLYSLQINGTGGVQFFLNELAASLMGNGSPPFTEGTEAVAGFIILAGASDSAALAGAELVTSLFAGGGTAPILPPTSSTPITDSSGQQVANN